MIVRTKLPPYQRSTSRITKRQKMISQTILKGLPNGTQLLESQVAGHTFQMGTDEIGNWLCLAAVILYMILTDLFSMQVCSRTSRMDLC